MPVNFASIAELRGTGGRHAGDRFENRRKYQHFIGIFSPAWRPIGAWGACKEQGKYKRGGARPGRGGAGKKALPDVCEYFLEQPRGSGRRNIKTATKGHETGSRSAIAPAIPASNEAPLADRC